MLRPSSDSCSSSHSPKRSLQCTVTWQSCQIIVASAGYMNMRYEVLTPAICRAHGVIAK